MQVQRCWSWGACADVERPGFRQLPLAEDLVSLDEVEVVGILLASSGRPVLSAPEPRKRLLTQEGTVGSTARLVCSWRACVGQAGQFYLG